MNRCRRLRLSGPVIQVKRVTPLYSGMGSPQVVPYEPTQRFFTFGNACTGVDVNSLVLVHAVLMFSVLPLPNRPKPKSKP